MADTKISALPSASTPLTGAEVLPIVQSGGNFKVSIANVTAGRSFSAAGLTLTGGTANGVTYLNASKVLTSGTALTFDGTALTSTVATDSTTGFTVTGGTYSATISPAGITSNRNGDMYVRATGGNLNLQSGSFWELRLATDNGSGPTTRVTVSNSGNLGLGVVPSAWATNRKVLQIGGLASSVLALNGTAAVAEMHFNSYLNTSAVNTYSATGFAGLYDFNNSTAGGFAWKLAPSGTAGNPITFTQAMTLDASGNLGIGTSSPSSKLHVNTAGTSNYITNSSNTADGSIQGIVFVGGSLNRAIIRAVNESTNGGSLQFLTYTGGTGTQNMTLTSGGNLGIGTTSPLGKLHSSSSSSGAMLSGNANQLIAESSGNAGLTIATGASSLGNIFFADSGDAADGYVQYDHSGRSMRFGTAAAERMRLDSAGNLGLGVTPSAWDAGGKAIELAAGSIFAFSSGAAGEMDYVYNTYYNAGWKYKASSSAASLYSIQAGVYKWFNAPSGTAGAAITFTQAMTLDASGNLLVGTTSAIGRIGASFPNSQYGFTASCSSASGTAIFNRFLYNTSTEVGSISSTGSVTLYNTTSDQRLKENISDAVSASALIDNLQVRQYNWKSDGSHQRYGFIAQELVAVAPEAVHQPENPEEMMAVDYSKLVPMLVKEIQSLRARVASLESK